MQESLYQNSLAERYMVIYVIDMFKINNFVQFYMHQYPEIKIHCSFDPYNYIVKWDFYAQSFNRYETYAGSCVAYDTEHVLKKLNYAFLYFLSTDGVKVILCKRRLEKL